MSIGGVGKADLGKKNISWHIGEKSGQYDHHNLQKNVRTTPYQDVVGVCAYADGVSLHLPEGVTVGTNLSLKDVLQHVAKGAPEHAETIPVVVTSVQFTPRYYDTPATEKKKTRLSVDDALKQLEADPHIFDSRKPPARSFGL